MATASVLEQIAQNIEATVGTLKTVNGYQLNIQRALAKNPAAHLNGYIYQLPPTEVTDAVVSTDEWKQAFAIVVYVIPNDGDGTDTVDTTPLDTYNNDIAASLYQALMADYTRGGLALNTIIAPTLYFPPINGEFSGITFMFDVHYRTAIDKPYVQV